MPGFGRSGIRNDLIIVGQLVLVAATVNARTESADMVRLINHLTPHDALRSHANDVNSFAISLDFSAARRVWPRSA